MALSPFHAYYKARTLTGYASGRLKLAAVYAASNIEIYPYQIAAARFALRSPYLKGAILCDEGSLGKSYEAMLVVTQMWYEGKERILLVVPIPLLGQWVKLLEDRFSVPFHTVDSNVIWNEQLASGSANPFVQDGILLTTYDFAAEKAEFLSQITWNLAVFEEAHHLRRIYTRENKGAAVLRQAVGDAFKLLLTATPMQNSIMDLYGLIYFIDEAALPDADSFYNRYFRKPEHYPELASRVSKFCFRTTRPQVAHYVKIPERIPITASFTLTEPEQRLYDLLDAYVQKPVKIAFPKMERYDLALMLFRTFSSSTFALAVTLGGVAERLSIHNAQCTMHNDENTQIEEMLTLARSITVNAKGTELLFALKRGFAELKRLGANKKALIFTENRTTQKYLFELLDSGDYQGKVLTYSGDKSRDYTVMDRFEKEAVILISTDLAAEGFNLEFCSFVVNFDLPYNTLTIEQRINRCHRQGQQSDVLVLSFLNQNNFADVRMLELVNKRILQFGGIFGMSDDLLGGLGVDLSQSFGKVLAGARSKEEIDKAYRVVLERFETDNKRQVAQAEDALFTTFTKQVADSVTVTPQYLWDKTKEINDDLWELTKYFFSGKFQFHLDDTTRTVSCVGSPPKVFTGAAMRRNEYSMNPKYQPASGRHTIAGTLAKNILGELFWVGIPDSGTVTIHNSQCIMHNQEDGYPCENNCELCIKNYEFPCAVGFYRVKVKSKQDYFGGCYYSVFVGKTADGRSLTHEECEQLMALPVVDFTKGGTVYGERDGISNPKLPHALDALLSPEEFIRRTVTETESAEKEEIERIRAMTADQKAGLDRRLDALRSQMKITEQTLGRAHSTLEKLESKKALAALQKQLKQGEQSLFMDGLRLDTECERQIRELVDKARFTVEIMRQFTITIHNS